MNNIIHSRIIIITLALSILLVTLYFGLRFKGFRLENHVTYLQGESGIHFERFGIAYIKLDDLKKNTSLNEFTIELALKPERSETYGFNIIMSINGGKDAGQFIVGQWQSHVIIMNGDDYSNKRKTKRMSADVFKKPYSKMMLTVTTGEKGSDLFINGELIGSRPDLTLIIPAENKMFLTLGNSVYGNNSWKGNMYGFTLYDYVLPHEKIKRHFKIWEDTKRYTGLKENNSLLFYDFNRKDKAESIGTVKKEQALNIPVYFPVLEKRILVAPWKGLSLNESSIKDITINLFGFIPMGFILYALFLNLSISQARSMLFSVLLCFIISLFIEITQTWIPSRSSQLLDLMLNTMGGLIGAIIAWRIEQSAWREA